MKQIHTSVHVQGVENGNVTPTTPLVTQKVCGIRFRINGEDNKYIEQKIDVDSWSDAIVEVTSNHDHLIIYVDNDSNEHARTNASVTYRSYKNHMQSKYIKSYTNPMS
jgi:uncharacterized protein YecE (DUF72 family)